MFEYNKNTISRILSLEGFELENLNLDEINHVPMHQYRVSTTQQPLLLVENLQVCIGLYAYSENFGFAAHLNPIVIHGNEFKYDENKNIVSCNRINDLYESITNLKPTKKVYIGLSLGFCPSNNTYKVVELLDKSIDNIIIKLNNIGIDATKVELQYEHVFILDSKNGNLIFPLNEKEIKKSK